MEREKPEAEKRRHMEETQRAQRMVLHIDLDAFYASIEQRDHPELRGKPVVVGGSHQSRGVVATCSYEARAFGVRSAMPARTAYQLCPQAIFLAPRFEVYRAVSQEIMAIFKSVTPLIEPLSLDEAYLDISSCVNDFREAVQLARTIKERIREETALTASAGVSSNKLLAKLGSDAHKPDGLTLITPEQALVFLDALPVEKFFGVGKVTAAVLREQDLLLGADLRQMGEERLRALLGSRGSLLYHYACAEDERPVEPERLRKSVGKEITLERDIADRDQMKAILARLAEQVERRLTDLELEARTLSLKVRWSDFQLITRSTSRVQGFRHAHEMLPVLYTLLSQLESEKRSVRLLGVFVSHLRSASGKRRNDHITALSLWDAQE
jgi:DNA polymerase IV